jgi:hypothetical protein
MEQHFIEGYLKTRVGDVPCVADRLGYRDYLGAIRVRWGIMRDQYHIKPGLYAVGHPASSSDVFVTANYKLSFDHLRKSLHELDAWILVLDTKGVNVWCAAGKGTFGTNELVNRIRATRLDEVIDHRRLIMPQLGAAGISAHEVRKKTETGTEGSLVHKVISVRPAGINFGMVVPERRRGFNVIYGPVKAAHIREFIQRGYSATPEMRRVTFTFKDRAKLIPIDFIYGKYRLLFTFAIVFLLSGLNRSGFSLQLALDKGTTAILFVFLAYSTGVVVTPLVLPYIPVGSFALKGSITGAILSGLLLFFLRHEFDMLGITAWFLIMTSISSFLALNFTGSSTYTSLSGVKKEMRIAIPLQIASSVTGLLFLVLDNMIKY